MSEINSRLWFYLPDDLDHLSIGNKSIPLKYLEDFHIDCRKKKVFYKIWVKTSDIFAFPYPNQKGAIYFDSFDFGDFLVIFELKNRKVNGTAHNACYHANKHSYLVSLSLTIDPFNLPPDIIIEDDNEDRLKFIDLK